MRLPQRPKIIFNNELTKLAAPPNDWLQQIGGSEFVGRFIFCIRAWMGHIFHFVLFFWRFIAPCHRGKSRSRKSVCPFRQCHFLAPLEKMDCPDNAIYSTGKSGEG
jgi:hypothetical protein